ncbi:MAG TPA: hypothetical protein VG818_10840, partial [Gemmatimonadaceae bacterium]|nr:hypothetical protein [Gemmatimonadaceae bacterium]
MPASMARIVRRGVGAALAVLAPAGLAVAQRAPARPDVSPAQQFVIENFKTESGVTLPRAIIVYGTYG